MDVQGPSCRASGPAAAPAVEGPTDQAAAHPINGGRDASGKCERVVGLTVSQMRCGNRGLEIEFVGGACFHATINTPDASLPAGTYLETWCTHSKSKTGWTTCKTPLAAGRPVDRYGPVCLRHG